MEALRILCFQRRGKDTQIFLRLKTEVGVKFGKIFFYFLTFRRNWHLEGKIHLFSALEMKRFTKSGC